MSVTALSVNINKFALIRNARGENNPNIIDIALKCIRYGVDGITVHPRPDGRHIKYEDVDDLKSAIQTELNVEGYPSSEFLNLIKKVKPDQVTLVPDPPEALTSSFGWDLKKNKELLKDCISIFQDIGVRSSLFLDPNISQLDTLIDINPDRIELYTYDYAHQYPTNSLAAIAPYKKTAAAISEKGIKINAGHDLDIKNVAYFLDQIPTIAEVSIGHALVCDALEWGLEETIRKYLSAVKG